LQGGARLSALAPQEQEQQQRPQDAQESTAMALRKRRAPRAEASVSVRGNKGSLQRPFTLCLTPPSPRCRTRSTARTSPVPSSSASGWSRIALTARWGTAHSPCLSTQASCAPSSDASVHHNPQEHQLHGLALQQQEAAGEAPGCAADAAAADAAAAHEAAAAAHFAALLSSGGGGDPSAYAQINTLLKQLHDERLQRAGLLAAVGPLHQPGPLQAPGSLS
jgi:hypothetical protein